MRHAGCKYLKHLKRKAKHGYIKDARFCTLFRIVVNADRKACEFGEHKLSPQFE